MTTGQILFKCNGRISRQDYWLKGVLPQLLYMIAIFAFIIGTSDIPLEPMGAVSEPELSPILFLFYIPAIWMSLAVAIKRFHDRDKSGWWVLIQLIPVIGPIWILIENGFLKGTDGSNRFGDDPLA